MFHFGCVRYKDDCNAKAVGQPLHSSIVLIIPFVWVYTLFCALSHLFEDINHHHLYIWVLLNFLSYLCFKALPHRAGFNYNMEIIRGFCSFQYLIDTVFWPSSGTL